MKAHVSYQCPYCGWEGEEKDVLVTEEDGMCCPDCEGEVILIIEE